MSRTKARRGRTCRGTKKKEGRFLAQKRGALWHTFELLCRVNKLHAYVLAAERRIISMTKRGEEVVASDSGWAHWETFKGHWRGVCSLIVSTGFLHLCDRESWFAPQHMNCLSQVFNQHDALPGMVRIMVTCLTKMASIRYAFLSHFS